MTRSGLLRSLGCVLLGSMLVATGSCGSDPPDPAERTYGSPAELAQALGCEAFEDHGMQAFEGRPPRAVGTCNLEETGLTIQVLPDEAALQQWARDATFACGPGVAEVNYATRDLWTINASDVGNRELIGRIATTLGADVVTHPC